MFACHVEWDVPKVPRHDLCTNVIENKVIYVQPTCANKVPKNHPRDHID